MKICDILKQYMIPGDSKSQIKTLIKSGGVYINGKRVGNDLDVLRTQAAIKQRYYVFRLAKKNFFTLDFGKVLNQS